MRKLGMVVLVPFFLGTLLISEAWTQPPGFSGGRGGREGGMRGAPPSPLMDALDTDKDGELSAEEIANAATALKTLDKDGNGKLTEDELRPQFGEGGPGEGGPGRGGPGGFGQDGESNSVAKEMVKRMLAFDKDGDGMLSRDEIPRRMLALLARADTNQDGYLSEEELLVLAEQQTSRNQQQQRGRRGGPGGSGRSSRGGF